MILKLISSISILLAIWLIIRIIIDWFIYKVLKHERENVQDWWSYDKKAKKYH